MAITWQSRYYVICNCSFFSRSRNFSNKSCPVCRAKVKNTSDSWVLTERPDSTDMAHESTDYLMDLADRSGIPDHVT